MAKNNETVDRVQEVWNILGGEEGVDRLIRGEITVSEPKPERKWREKDGVIYFSVTSYGMTGGGWIVWLESKGFRLSDYVKSILSSPDFTSTFCVTYKIAVLKGLFTDNDRVTKIRAEAHKRDLTAPKAEVACLIREKFSDKELEDMGLWWIVTMHEPIKDSYGDLGLLRVDRSGGGRWLSACYDNPGVGWRHVVGFAFEMVNS